MEYLPLLVGAGVGLIDGMIGGFGPHQEQGTIASTHAYAHTIYRVAVFSLGAYGDLAGKWNPDLSYGLMCSSATLLGTRLPSVVQSGPSAFGYSAPPGALLPVDPVAHPETVGATAPLARPAPSGPLVPDEILTGGVGAAVAPGCLPCGAGRAAPPRGVTYQVAGSVA